MGEIITYISDKRHEGILLILWLSMGGISLIFMIIFDFLKNNGNIIADLNGDDMIIIIMFMMLGPTGGTFIIIIYMKEYKEYREKAKKDARWWELREYGGWK